MADVPNITFHALSDRPSTVFVHLGEKVRTFTEANLDRLPSTLRNVLIAEFGLHPDHAAEVANSAVSDVSAAAGAKAHDADHIALLQEQIADNDKQLTEMLQAKLKAESDLSLARSDLADANKALAVAQDTISQMEAAQLKAQEQAIKNTPPTGESAAVGTQPEGQTPPAQQTHNPPALEVETQPAEVQTQPVESSPQTEAEAAPNQAVTGGEQGTH